MIWNILDLSPHLNVILILNFADQILVGQKGHSAFDKQKQYSDASCEILHMMIHGAWSGYHTFPMSNLFCIWYGLHIFMTVNDERTHQEANSFPMSDL